MKSLKLISSAIAMLICFVTMAQERTISGIVSDESKQPLPGVTVFNQTSKKKMLQLILMENIAFKLKLETC